MDVFGRWVLKWRGWLFVGVGLVVFGLSLVNGFVWDDEEQVVGNLAVHSLGNWPVWFVGSTFQSGGGIGLTGIYYKPVMSLMWAVFWVVGGGGAWLFHLGQVGIHLVVGYWVWKLLEWGLVRIYGRDDWVLLLGWWCGLIWLVHPMQVEAVVYVSALQEPLFMVFGLGAVWWLVRDVGDSLEVRWGWGKIVGVCILLLVSLLSKETGILMVGMVIGVIMWLGKRGERFNQVATIVLVVGLIYGLMRFGVAGVWLSSEGPSPIMRASLAERLLTMPGIWWFYLRTMVWPWRLLIAQHWVVREWSGAVLSGALGLVGLATAVGGIGWWRWSRGAFRWSVGWWISLGLVVAGIGFHSQVFVLDLTVAERWAYLGLAGMVGVVGLLIGWLLESGVRSRWIGIVGMVLVVGLSWRSVVRVGMWRSGLDLYRHDEMYNSEAFDLENNLGVELHRNGQMDAAGWHFERAVELAPWWWTNWNNLGVVWEANGRFEEALEAYKRSIDNGNYYLGYVNYARLLVVMGRREEAKSFLEKEALVRLPRNQQLLGIYGYVLEQEKE